ncbi:acyl--CoA ligase [Janibacter indicus]|uniref:Acyl--CoA ligase n=1 Tax=Janibacter indicus TaxID=857417 RepID=A0A7L9J4J7_9MICO|nr:MULTISPECIES: class I adenylate-forming enzyme family protein [Janibacter]MCW4602873.1 acyl--CoA ligase [Janibacter hoylei]QOK23915.1 acyl--CoA ligase [Janibacter indicus]
MTSSTTHHAHLRSAAEEYPTKVFLETTSADGNPLSLTFADLEERSRRVAAGLLQRGIRRGDRVAVALPNHAEWLELFYGVTRIGAVLVTLNVRYRETELDYMINQSGARMVVTAAESAGFDFVSFYEGFRAQIPGVDEVVFAGRSGADGWDALPQDPADEALADHEAAVAPDDAAVILYTSGTTGRPKGAVLTHRSILASAAGQAERLGTTSEDTMLCVMPLNHVGGITCAITSCLLTRTTVVMPPAFSPSAALADFARHSVTFFLGVPTMWSLMLADPSLSTLDTSTIRLAVVGGSNLEPTLATNLLTAFPSARLVNLYGLSECSGASILSAPDDDLDQVSRSLGTALTGVELRVMGPDDTECAVGEDGELQLRGDSVASGYWERPEETAQTFVRDGWLRTGDIVNRDEDGHVVMLGRLKEMYVQGGYNVYPVEVENVLTSHPAVAMAAGIGVPDEVLGEVGCYYVVLRPGEQVSEDELREHCGRRVADYKVPRRIVVVDELPTTPSGKIAKAVLREQHATG